MADSNGNTIVTAQDAGEFESNFIIKNQRIIAHFRRSGLYLVDWKQRKYEASPVKLLCSYIMWYLAELSCFGIAYCIKEEFKSKDFENRVNDFIEASFVVIVIGILPAFWIYLLREYNNNLPKILMTINKLEKTKMYERLEIYKDPVISFREGFLDEDYNDKEDEENKESQDSAKIQWWPVKYGPIVSLIASVILCLILILLSFVKDVQKLISEHSDALKHVKKELPFFVMSILYPIPYFIGIWFCIFFLEWQRKLYESIRRLIREIKKSSFNERTNTVISLLRAVKKISQVDELTFDTSVPMDQKEESDNTENLKSEERLPVDQQEELDISEETASEKRQPLDENKELERLWRKNTRKKGLSRNQKRELESIDDILNKVQKAFIILNKKIFQKTIVLGFVVFMFMGVFCCWKVLQASSNFAYMIPFSLSIAHIYLVCKWSNDLMKEYQETIEVLNEMIEEDVENIRRELDKSPPEVLAFGGFSVNYSMMTAVLAFIISCIGIPEEMWPEDKEEKEFCYPYDDGSGVLNQTLCFNKNILIGVNRTLGYIKLNINEFVT